MTIFALVGSPGVEPLGRVLASVPGHTELERLCGMILAFPATAERLLNPRRVPDPVLLNTLRAETALRLDRPREAATLARQAVSDAATGDNGYAAQLLPAATVLADAAVLAGAPDAIASCADVLALADRLGDIPRAVIVAGLHAIAVFQQHSCRRARQLLDQIGARHRDPGTAAALTRAAVTLDDCCARRGQPHWPPASRPVITAGGRVQPTITEPFLTDRLLRWPGCHDCTPAVRRPS
jgi:hypothetical protein